MLRWAILGTSFISETMMGAVSNSPGSTATVVYGRDPDRLEDFRARHGIERSTTSLDDAVADAQVDAVYVGLPNHIHHLATIAAARAGKAVLSEKSLTVTNEQANALLAAVDGTVFFVEGLMYLAHPVMARFVEVLGDGRLGRLKSVHATYAADIWQLVNPAGGGAIFDLGCYPASLVQLVVDTIEGDGAFGVHRLSATGHRSASGTDDAANVTESAAVVQFDSGALATIHTAETYGMTAHVEVHGEHGVLAFESNPWLPAPGANSFRWTPFDGESERFVVDDPLDAFDHQIRMVEAHVAAGRRQAERPSPRLEDSRTLLRMLAAWDAATPASTPAAEIESVGRQGGPLDSVT